MRKQYRLRWKPEDSKNLERAINRFNRKLTSLEKKNPELKGVLPERASYNWYRDVINTRYDLTREIRTLDKFSKPGQEQLYEVGQGVKITKWQLSESERRVNKINKEREARLQKRLATRKYASGKSLGYIQADMGLSSPELMQYQPMKIVSDSTSQTGLAMKWKSIIKQSSQKYYDEADYRWRRNYIKSLEENFGSQADELIAHIKSMPIGEYLDIAYGDIDSEIKFNYPDNFSEQLGRLDQLYDIWKLDKSNLADKFDETIVDNG